MWNVHWRNDIFDCRVVTTSFHWGDKKTFNSFFWIKTSLITNAVNVYSSSQLIIFISNIHQVGNFLAIQKRKRFSLSWKSAFWSKLQVSKQQMRPKLTLFVGHPACNEHQDRLCLLCRTSAAMKHLPICSQICSPVAGVVACPDTAAWL